MPKLTKTTVDTAEIREKQYTLWCSELKGFGVYVHPTGCKTYFVDYRSGGGKRRRMTIGRHGVITTEQARKLAIETLGGVVLQKADPLAERQSQRHALTVAQLCDHYLEAARKGVILGRTGQPKKASTIEIDVGRIERHIKPLLGTKLVRDLTRADVIKFVEDVTLGKTAMHDRSGKNGNRVIVTGGAGTAARTVGFLGGIMTYAVDRGIIEKSPVSRIPRRADGTRERRLTADEYGAIGSALTGDLAQVDAPQALAGAWLIALSGCRLGEIEQLRRSEVDVDGGCFRLADTKTGPSVRPIGKAALGVVQSALRVPGNPYVLPSARGQGGYFKGLPGYWVRLMKRAGLEGVTPHVMRHSFASVAADLGYADSTIAALLGHSGGGVTRQYIHRLDAVLIAAANNVAGEIERQMNGRNPSD